MSRRMIAKVDLAIVGAGIVGLACARAGAAEGLRTLVIDREARAVGASIRNFGFVTVTGQRAGTTWNRARRSRDIWAELAPRIGLPVVHEGLLLPFYREESDAIVAAFLKTDAGRECALLDPDEARVRAPMVRGGALRGALASPHELRIDPREALPKLADWLARTANVGFLWGEAVSAIESGALRLASGATIEAPRIIVAPGPDLRSLLPDIFTRRATRICQLQMLRLADPGWRLPAAIMSDLSLARYAGYADLPESEALKDRLSRDAQDALKAGVHVIVVQNADGTLVIGDSHHEEGAPLPFLSSDVDEIIMREVTRVLDLAVPRVLERWNGYYPVGPDDAFIDRPAPGVRLVSVTSGTGMSTAFAFGEEALAGFTDTA
ncbi:MAG: TIGR03364 family FAD-dependent oxidoreductase [Alphaproteobacteria bacterium]|nr:TIGR03364 family FAD-dependent oxidoreductase [Alphaproteobacteria bacterium]